MRIHVPGSVTGDRIEQWNHRFLCCPTCGNTDLIETRITTDTGRDYALECDTCGEAFPDER
jgi:translation initiation factor 2 beta subunit (eIF-2beta)/eIF-5